MASGVTQIKKTFLEVLAQPTSGARRAYVDQACGDDVELRACLLEMLEAHEHFATPVPGDETRLFQPDDAAARQGLPQGTVVAGKYKIIDALDEGGMGIVYRASQIEGVRRDVALKIIKPGLDSRQVLARFNVERQALAMMNHENIAKVFDAGMTERGHPFFVMELVKGGRSLTKYCDEEKLSVAARLELFARVCQAVQHAHQKGIVHRDLKPKNVLVSLVDDKPVPKVIDFGLAKAIHQPLTEDSIHTLMNTLVGTYRYMAPEQAKINNLDVDTRADVYSLGVILYELLTGKTPIETGRLENAAFYEVLRVIREEEPQRPSVKLHSSAELPSIAALRRVEPTKLERLVRGDLDWVVMKALEKDRNRRYGTASEFARDVEHYLHDEPVEARPPTVSYRLSKAMHKHKGKVLVASLLVVTIVAGAVVSTIGWVKADREKKRANQQAAIARAVNDFLKDDLLSEVDPAVQIKAEQAFVSDLKVKQALDRAAANVGARFPDQPLVEAGIRHTIGKTYLGLGDLKAARIHLEKAEELRRHASGNADPDRLSSLYERGWLLFNDGKTSQAEEALREAAELRAAALGAMHPDTLRTRYALGVLFEYQDKPNEAQAILEEVLEQQKRTLTMRHRDTLMTQRQLASVLQAKGDLATAEKLLVETLEALRSLLGREHPESLTTQNNLAMVYADEKKREFAKAEALLVDLTPISERVLGPEHPQHLAYNVNLATVLADLKRFDDAIALYQKVIPTLKRVSGPTAYVTLAAVQNYAAILARLGRHAEAETLLLDAHAGCKSALGDGHDKTKLVVQNLIDLYGLMKKPDEVKRWQGVMGKAMEGAR